MESVIIAAPCAYDLELKTRLERLGPVGVGAAGVVFIEDGRSRDDWIKYHEEHGDYFSYLAGQPPEVQKAFEDAIGI